MAGLFFNEPHPTGCWNRIRKNPQIRLFWCLLQPFTHFVTLLRWFFVYLCIVKVIRFIFALYILYMAVYPCSDSKTCVDERNAGIALVNQANHDHSSSEQDLCTPFCICSCCAAHVQIKCSNYASQVNLPLNTKLIPLYLEKPIINNGVSIWQPPKS
jgi:hypothetical protein